MLMMKIALYVIKKFCIINCFFDFMTKKRLFKLEEEALWKHFLNR